MASEVIKLNLIPSGEMPTYHCSQFDNGRLILIDLFNGEDEYSLPAGYTAELHTRKMDNNIVTLATTSVSSNHLTFTSTEQLTACAGNNLSEVSIKDASDYVVGTLNFWLYVEKDPLAGGLTSTSAIHDLTDQIEEITTEIVGENYYNKTETDDLLDLKADKSTTYTKTEVNTLLNSKADASSVYTKSETNTLLSAKADADDVYTKSQVETKLSAKADANSVYTKSETDTLLSTKADVNGVYSKAEVDGIVDDIEDAIDLKADQSTTYTKTQVNNALALKADTATTYTKTEVDTTLALKANAADVYTKTEVDNIILDIMPVDTVSGPIASFNTELAAPLVNVSCKVKATGGNGTPDNPNPINGYTEANITRCGINQWNEVWELGGINGSGQPDAATTRIRSVDFIPLVPNTTYYIKSPNYCGVYFYDDNKAFISANIYANVTITPPANARYLKFTPTSQYGTTYNNDISINYPSSDTSYHPYTGNTYTIAFGQTVYGGVLDVTRGKLKPCIEYPSYNGETLSGRWLSSEATYIEGTTPPTGSQVVSLDDYGSDIDLTPEVISAVVGTNNVYSDTNGDTTVKFRDSIQHYIDTHTGG